MKKFVTVITSALLCVSMLVLAPAQVIASAAESNGKKYISEVKVGMGKTSDEASKELLADGYTILADDQGEYADLNKDAGAKSPLKQGPNQKIVYLGYKTTDDASDAVTDLAVMNMNGGYSYEDYDKLMQTQMDSQIKPFVSRFVATLNEYRANLKKPQDSANYKRASYFKTLLNKLTDDDTGGRPLGDLLVNPTKYEMGDEAYNKLSDTEKKNHCDIVTLLMQGNGQAVQLMETELTKASDSSDDTWLDRFQNTSLEKLSEEIKKENPTLTPTDINKELDKKYNDDAKKIRDKWSAFNEILLNYDNALDSLDEVAETPVSAETNVTLTDNSTDKEVQDAAVKMYKDQGTVVQGGMAAEDIVTHDHLASTNYGKTNLLDFFQKNVAEFNGDKNIRALYPMVDALSGGQLAGLDFISIKDMIVMAISDESGFKDAKLDGIQPASIYQDVNREIYEKGGVALTNDALRAKAAAQEVKSTFELSGLGIAMWMCTAAAGVAAVGTVIASKMEPSIFAELKQAQQNLADFRSQNPRGIAASVRLKGLERTVKNIETSDKYKDALKQFASKSTVCRYLAMGFTIAMVVLAGISIYTTISELMAYYKVDFAPIPKYIVEQADITEDQTINGKKQTVMIKNQTAYYKVVTCNRTDGGGSAVEKKNHEILKDRADLNGDVGQQWLALYSVKYEDGTPILADSLKMKLGSGAPEGYDTGIHMFGETAVQNLTDEKNKYSYNDPYGGTYVYFKRDVAAVKEQTAAGSLFSGGSIALGAIIGLLVGGGLMALLIVSARKRKENAGIS